MMEVGIGSSIQLFVGDFKIVHVLVRQSPVQTERVVDHQKLQRLVAHMSASPGRHGYGQSCRRKSHKTDQADRNGGCLMGEGRCWTCPTVRWTQRRAACRKSWSRSSHSRTVSWPPEHTLSQQPAPWRRFPCGL